MLPLIPLLSLLAVMAESQDKRKTCTQCTVKISAIDPHLTCLRHNVSCFKGYEYDPTGCTHCTTLFDNYKTGAAIHLAAFKDRIVAMQRSIKHAVNSTSASVPVAVKARFDAGVRNPFAPHARHLDPRPRSRAEPYSSSGETPNPLPKPIDLPGQAITQTGTNELLLSPPGAPVAASTFEGFNDQATPQETPDEPLPSTSRGRPTKHTTRVRSSSSSTSPTPRRKLARRERDHDFATLLHQKDAATNLRIEQCEANTNKRMDDLAKSIAQVSQMMAAFSRNNNPQQPANPPQQPQNPPQQPRDTTPPPVTPLADPAPPHPAPPHPEVFPDEDQEWWDDHDDYEEDYPAHSEVDPYDPNHPELEVPADLVGRFFYLPDEAEVYDDAIVFKGRVCNPDSFDWDTHRGKDIMTPLQWSADISFLIDEAPKVTSPMEQEETKGKYFACVRKIVDKNAHSRWGLESIPDQLSLSVGRPSRFLLSLKTDFPTKPMPFSLSPNPTSGSQAEALAFAAAPKLGKDAHVLPGLLTTFTKDLPDALRSKDFAARQQLHGLLFAHETSKFLGNIGEEALKKGGGENSVMRSMERISSNAVIPTLQALISNAINTAIKIRRELRERALAPCKNPAIKVTLQGGSLFSATLFDPENIKQAEDCARNLPPVFNINMPKAQRSLPFSGGHSSSFRGSARGRGSFRGAQSSQRGPRSHRDSSRGSYYSQASSSHYQDDGPSYEDRQWRQQQRSTTSTRKGGPRNRGKGSYRGQKNKAGGRK